MQMYYAGLLLFILSLGLSKMSIVLFQTRLIATQWQRRIFRAVIIFIGIWMAASILALALQCDLSNPWLVVDKMCPGVVRITYPSRSEVSQLTNSTPRAPGGL